MERRTVKYIDCDETDLIIRLHGRGWSDVKIGNEVGRSRQVIQLFRKRHGLPAIKRPKESYLKSYRASIKKNGNFAERRWEEKKYQAFLEGAPHNVTPTEWMVLKKIMEGVNMTRDIATALGLNKHNVRQRIEWLKKKNYIYPGERVGKKGVIWKLKGNIALSSQSQTSLGDTNLESSVTDLEHGTPVMSS